MKLNIHLLTHLVFFFFFIHLPTSLCANDCSLSFDCGDIVGITYPFWGNSRPDYCGHPSFELTCQDNITQINIMSETYQVLSIYQTAKTMRIVRMDFLFGNCPSRFGADNLDFTHFNYTVNDENLNMFYNCSSLINGFRYSCEENNRGAVYAFLDPMPQNLPCDTSVVSVLRSAVDDRFSTLGQVLKKGFDVHYVVNDPPPPPAIPPPTPMNNGSGDVSSPPTQEAPPAPIPSTPMNNQTGNIGTPPAQEAPAIPPTAMNNQTGDVQKKVSKVPSKNATVVIATTAVVLVFVVIATIVVILCCLRRECSLVKLKFGKKKTKNAQNIEMGLAPKSYKYSKIKKMTNFKKILGKGGYGVVYEGKMNDDMVAVKVLEGKKGDFKNEFDTICSTSHDNIVRLRGYCNEKSHSVLIYDYMPKGSLEKYIFDHKKPSEEYSPFGWMKLYEIAVGIARGLKYLHNDCGSQILHLDIKPQNILLDKEFRPKISDFGLSKLCYGKINTVSIECTRGTEGYIAPELQDPTGRRVSPKSDVYSYGMMLLEMVAGKTNLDLEPNADGEYILNWIQKRLEQPADLGLPQVITEEDEKMVRTMSKVGFQCIKTNRSDRPEMIEVLQMLQEGLEA